ncbi:cation transport protein-domain-containing protein [Suillus paluster]|uniref:cation transport protein-domain-containing protein n=1 Tax=Suillus paluster TaxID=48578 RepID=UPI001B8816BA|nr:cation transport protein-domain-containing protein [Suillus paluster]KAG1737883.1 cation transport protein-domain-containing protein [Suillus paluster]
MPTQASSSSFSEHGVWQTTRTHLNFFRIHVIFFTVTPLIFSGIFYASNGRYPVAYIDALYNSVSAITVCGLATVNLSQLTAWQQVLLFIQMCIGNPVIVSWVMVYTRRHYFARRFDHIIEVEAARQAAIKVEQQLTTASAGKSTRSQGGWSRRFFRRKTGLSMVPEDSASDDARTTPKKSARRLRPDMIRRVDAPPKLVNPSGWVTESGAMPMKRFSLRPSATSSVRPVEEPTSSPHQLAFADERTHTPEQLELDGDVEVKNLHVETVNAGSIDLERSTSRGAATSAASTGMPRTVTVEFAPAVSRSYHPLFPVGSRTGRSDSPSAEILSDFSHSGFSSSRPRLRRSSAVPQHSHVPMAQHPTTQTHRSSESRRASSLYPPHSFNHVDQPQEQMLRGFGGFPMPHELLGMLFGWLFPHARNRLERTMTIPVTTTLTGGGLGRTMSGAASTPGRPTHGGSISAAEGTKPVTYISFDAVVGRNSAFHFSTNEQLEELGGIEYRALNALLWLVPSYHIAVQLVSFVVIAPYMSMPKWASDFEPPALFRKITVPWFSLFQVVSAYTNTGTSLVDQSMVPFQTAYPMIFFMMFCILAGNTAFYAIRFTNSPFTLESWIITKLVPRNSRLHETLHFLLDHPRRCFVYLFPSYQTWFLFTILVIMNLTDWFCFMVLDIGNPDIDSIPLGTRLVAGLLQAIAVRAAGFGIVPLARIAPAVKVMYVIMMYISVYPIALSVRSTNVYEEQSLGIYKNDNYSEDEIAFSTAGPRMTVWSRYLAMHARQQLSSDMWWLCLALVLVCIIERGNLDNTEIQGWFNIFTIIFELVSAYGTVGLSLGIPTENYSFSGALKPLSKLIFCLVMLRGRHRGLPVAIDRAILLPYEFEKTKDEPLVPATHDERRSSSRNSESLYPRDPLQNEDGPASGNERQDEKRSGTC